MSLKLFRVEIEDEFYCIAKDEREARGLADEFLRDTNIEASYAHEVRPEQIPRDWHEGLLYHNLDGDFSVADFVAGKVPQ
jgi:hypothetical protein